jgi:hypothetical protein
MLEEGAREREGGVKLNSFLKIDRLKFFNKLEISRKKFSSLYD